MSVKKSGEWENERDPRRILTYLIEQVSNNCLLKVPLSSPLAKTYFLLLFPLFYIFQSQRLVLQKKNFFSLTYAKQAKFKTNDSALATYT